MTHAPNTIFERHPLPWRTDGQLQIWDANNERMCGVHDLVIIINADALKPFRPGWYWAIAPKGEVRAMEIASIEGKNSLRDCRWTIGKFIGDKFEEAT